MGTSIHHILRPRYCIYRVPRLLLVASSQWNARLSRIICQEGICLALLCCFDVSFGPWLGLRFFILRDLMGASNCTTSGHFSHSELQERHNTLTPLSASQSQAPSSRPQTHQHHTQQGIHPTTSLVLSSALYSPHSAPHRHR